MMGLLSFNDQDAVNLHAEDCGREDAVSAMPA
jgi:hypothetical protein